MGIFKCIVTAIHLLIKTCAQWWQRDPFTYSASTAYYAVFSMPGLLIIILSIATLIFERDMVEGQILDYMTEATNESVAQTLDQIISVEQQQERSLIAFITGLAILFFGASGLFIQLQRSLNYVWDVEVKKSAPILEFLKSRATAFGLVVSIGFLLLISLTITALLTAATNHFSSYFPAYAFMVAYIVHFAVSMGFISLLFGMIYMVLPDVQVRWSRALRGGVVAALLFSAGQYGLAQYFDMARPGSAFGAAGSVIILMIWAFYSCLVLLFGAQFTRVYAEWRDGDIKPLDIAQKKYEHTKDTP